MKRLIDPVWTAKTPARQFLTAMEFLSIVAALRWAFGSWAGEQHAFLPGYAALAAATWLGTWRAGLVVAGASVATLPVAGPDFNGVLRVASSQNSLSLLAFVLVAGIIVYMTNRASRRLRTLREEVDRLGQADKKKSEALALIAHELRNPLAVMSMGEWLIKNRELDPRSLQDTCEMMQRQTVHMKRLVADLLDAARIEQRKIELRRERIDIRALVGRVVRDAEAYLQPKQQAISMCMPDEPGGAFVDPMRLEQVLGNLLHNASKFSPEGAAIDVTVTVTADDVRIAVRDHGIGIPASELRTIFASFVQLRPRADSAPGLGLGLALCTDLLQLHGGGIEAHSAGVGCGAEFVVRFPRALHDPAAAGGTVVVPCAAHRSPGAALRAARVPT